MSTIEIPRDRWKRPLIIPLGDDGRPDLSRKPVLKDGRWTGGVSYTRVSTLAKSLDDTSNLMTWKQRVTALGLNARPDLLTRVAAVVASYDDPLNTFEAKKKLNAIVGEAATAGGSDSAASQGTALHEITEAIDLGRDVDLSGEWGERLTEYKHKRSSLTVLDKEVFVVNDELQAAGSFDSLLGCPDGRARVDDLKTGLHDASYPLGVTTQVATYANSRRYDPVTGERTPIHPDLDLESGLLTHMPARGEGTRIYELDLIRGWRAAQTAAIVHEIRKWKPADLRRELELV